LWLILTTEGSGDPRFSRHIANAVPGRIWRFELWDDGHVRQAVQTAARALEGFCRAAPSCADLHILDEGSRSRNRSRGDPGAGSMGENKAARFSPEAWERVLLELSRCGLPALSEILPDAHPSIKSTCALRLNGREVHISVFGLTGDIGRLHGTRSSPVACTFDAPGVKFAQLDHSWALSHMCLTDCADGAGFGRIRWTCQADRPTNWLCSSTMPQSGRVLSSLRDSALNSLRASTTRSALAVPGGAG
jgi:hypothetical protein